MWTSIVSGAIGGGVGLLKYLIEKKMEFSHEQQLALMQKAGLEYKDQRRAGMIKDSGVSFTRRTIAFIFSVAVVSPVFYAWFYPDAVISIPVQGVECGIWDIILPWKECKEVTTYKEVKAPVLAMPIIDLCSMMVGYYFGSGGTRKGY